jgi:chromosome segregation ATPase
MLEPAASGEPMAEEAVSTVGGERAEEEEIWTAVDEIAEEAAAKLRELRTRLDQLKTELALADAGLEAAESTREEVRREIASIGMDPDRLDDELAGLQRQVREALAEVEAFLAESELLIERGNTEIARSAADG